MARRALDADHAGRLLRAAYRVYFDAVLRDPDPRRIAEARARCRELHVVVYGDARLFPLAVH